MNTADLLASLFTASALQSLLGADPALQALSNHVAWGQPMAQVAFSVSQVAEAQGYTEELYEAILRSHPKRDREIRESARRAGVWGLLASGTLRALDFWIGQTGPHNVYGPRRALAQTAGLPVLQDPKTPTHPKQLLLDANARSPNEQSREQLAQFIYALVEIKGVRASFDAGGESIPYDALVELGVSHPAATSGPAPAAAMGSWTVDAADARPENIEVQEATTVSETGFLDFAFLANGAAAGATVARVVTRRVESGQETGKGGTGSGFLLKPGLFLTNHHVVNARGAREPDASADDLEAQTKLMVVEFDVDSDTADGTKVLGGTLLAWHPRNTRSRKDGLDFALVELTGPPLPDGSSRDALVREMRSADRPMKTTDAINCIQHPGGQEKQLALRSNQLQESGPTALRYYTNTEPGSSGSPLFDDDWRVVGLHRAAIARDTSYQGKTRETLNVGTPIHEILESLRSGDAEETDGGIARAKALLGL
ncbi:MAG: trypsin-like peptidase domain-containing protein [Deltaproteobacteria bacterium]|nr:trypsin-like peptidase domain-containing protein [Deltaproteobacteria bacterium]